ncbi:S-layer homology domain-containing protein, partial [Evtepia sp.]
MGHTIDLEELILNDWKGEATFHLPEGETLGCTLEGTKLTAGQELGDLEIQVDMAAYDVNGDGEDEYTSGLGYIKLKIVEKEDPPDPVITVPPEEDDPSDPPQEEEEAPSITQVPEISVTYGETKTFIVQGGEGSGETTFRVEQYGGYGNADIDKSSGILTPTEVGKVLVYAEKEGERSNPVLVHILPAPLTIQVKNQTAYVGSAAPTLTAADYTVTGLVGEDKLAKEPTIAYVTTPDMTRPGAVAIQVSGAEIPNSNYDPNITYVPGVLTIQEVPSYTITVQPVENGSIVSDLDTAKEGDTVTLTTKPAEGYLLDTLTVTSDALAPGTVSVKDMGEGIYTFSMPAGNVTVSGTMVPEEATQEWPPFPFDDVSEGDWYYDSVYYVYAYGLMNGTAEATFNPDGATTRGMLVTILYRMEGSPQGGGWSPFTDVDPELYYAQPIAWAAWNGIVKGITETTFSPDAPVTRQQMAAILYRYAAWKKWDVSQQGNLFQFTDWEQIQEYARTPLAWASAAGLIQGKENNILDPAGTATRAQVATLLQRFHSAYVAPA